MRETGWTGEALGEEEMGWKGEALEEGEQERLGWTIWKWERDKETEKEEGMMGRVGGGMERKIGDR